MTSVQSTIALGLGVMKATDLLRQVFTRATGYRDVAPYLKSTASIALAGAVAYHWETDPRRRVELAGAVAGLASVLHGAEQVLSTSVDRNRAVSERQGAQQAVRQAMPGRAGVQRI